MKTENLIKIISSSSNMYVFDALSNNIYAVESKSDFDKITFSDFGHETGLRKELYKDVDVNNLVRSKAKTLVLEITEECNIRCSYCVFDEDYESERNHGEKTMSMETAKKAIEYFCKRIRDDVGYIVFYGGEPLLEFEKIKELVNFAKKISGNKIKFSLTTNGINLSKPKVEFFIENDFLITVSLDGDKETHDKYRLTKKGSGTFDVVMSKINLIKKINTAFFEKNIIINCVISDANDISQINNFFSNGVFSVDKIRFSPAIQRSKMVDDSIIASISVDSIQNRSKPNKSLIENQFIEDIIEKIKFRKLDEEAFLGKKVCVPFSNRTYIRSNGNMQFCERIGNFNVIKENSGIDNIYQNSLRIIEEFSEFKLKDCQSCFAYNFCEMCPASFIKNGYFNKFESDTKCNQFRAAVKEAMTVYINREETKNDKLL